MDNIFEDLRKLSEALSSGDWEPDKVGGDQEGRYVISTVLTPDHGYETAIKKNGRPWVIVQRYPDRESAEQGHETWRSICETNKPIAVHSVQLDEVVVL